MTDVNPGRMHWGTAPKIPGDVFLQELEVDVVGIESIGVSFLWPFSITSRENRI